MEKHADEHHAVSPAVADRSFLEEPCSTGTITGLLRDWEADPEALSELFPAVYQRLRALARAHLGTADRTLQPTALIHEVYLELEQREDLHFPERKAFFAFAGFLMRRVLARQARDRQALKRGGACLTIALDDDREPECLEGSRPTEILALDQALHRLEEVDPRKCRLIEMRFFAGLELEEIADFLSVSTRTLKRDWQVAKRFLAAELSGQS